MQLLLSSCDSFPRDLSWSTPRMIRCCWYGFCPAHIHQQNVKRLHSRNRPASHGLGGCIIQDYGFDQSSLTIPQTEGRRFTTRTSRPRTVSCKRVCYALKRPRTSYLAPPGPLNLIGTFVPHIPDSVSHKSSGCKCNPDDTDQTWYTFDSGRHNLDGYTYF